MKNTPLLLHRSHWLIALASSGFTAILMGLFMLGQQQNASDNRESPRFLPSRAVSKAAPAPSQSFSQPAAKAADAVVHIHASNRGIINAGQPSSGSGVIVSSNGYVVTNYHVIESCEDISITLHDRRQFNNVKVVGKDPDSDIAVLKLSGDGFPYLPFGESDSTNVGDWVLAVGNPFELNSTVTSGIVSALSRKIDALNGNLVVESFIQTDAVVNHGNSGGALVNIQGELVGLITAIITRSGAYEGYSFAIPSNLVRKVLEDIVEFGEVRRGFLGAAILEMSPESAAKAQLNAPFGVLIERVYEKGPAEVAGLKSGDVILALEGTPIRNKPHYLEKLYRYRPNDKVTITLLRERKKLNVAVTLHQAGNTFEKTLPAKKENPLTYLGIRLNELDPKERQSFGGYGVRVSSIEGNSIIGRTNMDPEFVISRINKKRVATVNEAAQILSQQNGKVMLEGRYAGLEEWFTYVFVM